MHKIRELNLALYGKECWRLVVDQDSLWFKVLSARYGIEEVG